MSAWVVTTTHIDVLIAYGLSDPADKLHWRKDPSEPWTSANIAELNYETASVVGRTLIEENVASVCALYEGDTADEYADALGYSYTDPHYVLTPGEALRAVSCLAYQSCEHGGWETSQANAILEAIKARACSKLEAGPWGWDAEALAEKPKQVSLYSMMRDKK